MNDRFWIEKVVAGETDNFRHLVEKYKQGAFSLSLSIVKNHTVAEDVVQESFIQAYRHLKKFNFQSQFSTWFYTIIVRQSYKYCKTKIVYAISEEDIDDKVLENLSDYQSQLEKMKEEERKYIIKHAISTLSEIEQVCMQLFYWEEMSVAEISDIVNLSITNIKVILYRGRQKLYNQLRSTIKI